MKRVRYLAFFRLLVPIIPILILIPEVRAFELQLHGFGSLIGAKTNSLYPISPLENPGTRLTLDPESALGLNLSSDLGDRLVFASQLLASGDQENTYKLKLIWMFLTYRPIEGWAIRVGRQINPLFIYSEQLNVGFVTPWVRHPTEVYGSNPLDAFNGLSLIYTHLINDWELRAQLFGGAGNFSLGGFSGTLDAEKGLALSISSDHFSFRTTYSSTKPHITGSVPVVIASTPAGSVYGNLSTAPVSGTIQNFAMGTSFNWRNFIGSSEMIRLVSTGSFVRSAFGAYGMLGYHVLPDLTPYVIYAWNNNLSGSAYLFPDTTVSTTPKLGQHSTMAGIGFKASSSLIVKGEYMRTEQEFMDSTKNFGANVFSLSADFVF